MRKVILTGIILFFLFSSVCVCYSGIRIKPHGGKIINPNLSYIMSETVVRDGRLVSDNIIERRLISINEVEVKIKESPKTESKISKVLHRWGLRLLDMFVCNVE